MQHALDALLGNVQFKRNIIAALENGQLTHSILLCGESGTGTGLAARCIAADYLYPKGGTGAAQVLKNENAEVILLQGEGVSGEIKIDAVRAMRKEIYSTSLSAQGRVVILRNANKLNAASANALLKVIEEPPQGVLFLLTAPSEASVLQTIRSRCNIYTLAPVNIAECTQYLQQKFPEESVEDLAVMFGGKIGSAMRCLQDSVWKQTLSDAKELAAACEQKNAYPAMVLLTAYEKDRPGSLRLLSLYANVCSAAMQGVPMPISAKNAAASLPFTQDAVKKLSANGSGKLILTNLAIRIAKQ